MDSEEKLNILEAVLFASGEPLNRKRLSEILEIDEDEVEKTAKELSDLYDYSMRGIKLIRLENSYQLCSRKDYAPYVRKALETRRGNPLSSSALEVLAIIAYKQPVTRAYIEQVRGVDSTYTVSSLLDKELIENCGRLDVPGRPALYRTTENFLRAFGISDLKELPFIKEFEREDVEQLAFGVVDERDK